jgi:LuxR family maltose regulon positive regulatory protein
LHVDAGDDAQAHDVLRELCVIGEMCKSSRLLLVGLAERIRLHALKSQAFTCVALQEKLDAIARTTSQTKSGVLRELLSLQILIAHAYVAMAQQNWRAMIEILDQTSPLLDHLHRGRERVQVMFMQALATLQIGGNGEASLDEAFSLAEMYGLRQLSKEFLPLLGAWGRRYESSVQSTAVVVAPERNEEKKEQGSGKGVVGHKSSVAQTSMLTPREYQILSLLSRHMTNKEIGNAINIGEETVKWHLKNIYGKLHAGTRKHVIARARIMGILE